VVKADFVKGSWLVPSFPCEEQHSGRNGSGIAAIVGEAEQPSGSSNLHTPSACPACGGAIEETHTDELFQEEIPRQPIRRKFTIHCGRCTVCRNNLSEFFERFKTLNVRSNDDLDKLVAQAQSVVRGVAPQALRDDRSVRERVASQLTAVQASLDGLMVDRPRRRIIRDTMSGEV